MPVIPRYRIDCDIRIAVPADKAGIMRVFVEVAKDRRVSIATSFEMMARAESIMEYLNASEDPGFTWHAFVAVVDAMVVGVCDILTSPLSRTGHVAEIGVGVLEGFRGFGIGRGLMREALDWLRNRGVLKARLFVLEGNERALGLYKTLGFERTGVYKDEASIDNGFMDLLILEKAL